MLALALGVSVAGCGDDDGTMPGTDAGQLDAGRTDAGGGDAGRDAGLPPDDAGMETDAGMESDAGLDPDAGSDEDAGTDGGTTPTADGLAAVREATVGAQSPALPVRGVTVTYVRPAIGNDPAGFFVQAEQTGPAILVTADPGLDPVVAVGDVLDFDVTETTNLTGVLHVSMATGWSRSATGEDVMPLVQDVSGAADLYSNGESYVSELVLAQGTLRDFAATSGTGHAAYGIDTAGVNGEANLLLRLAAPLVGELGLGGAAGAGCQVTVGPSPLWRYFQGATHRVQLMGYQASDIVVTDCPALIVSGAMATTDTTVVVTFSRPLDADSVAAGDFTFDGGLTAASVVLSADGTQATVTLSGSMMQGAAYEVTVTGVDDAGDGDAIEAAMNTASFTGLGPTSVPGEGDLVITEIMYNPSGSDTNTEWIELHNPSATVTYQLNGCIIDDLPGGGASPAEINTSVLVAPGAYVVIGGAMSETSPVFTWGAGLNNGNDSVVLTCGGVTVDRVDYADTGAWPANIEGVSLQLSSTAIAGDNNIGSVWCHTPEATTYGTRGDRGSPNAANAECTVPTPAAPTVVSASATDATTVTVTFSDALDPASVEAGDFIIAGLTVSAATLSADGRTATLTTDAQTEGASYTVTVTGVDSADGVAIDTASNTAMFTGYTAPVVTAPNIIFSEYTESTTGTNKAIEITNLGAQPVSLDACSVRLHSNGQTGAGSTFALTGRTLAAGASLSICNSAMTSQPAGCITSNGVTGFNGDDALTLVCDGTVIDMFGTVGHDPGTSWSGGDPVVRTENSTLRRMCSVTSGNPTGFTDPSIEWESFPEGDRSGFGTHCPE